VRVYQFRHTGKRRHLYPKAGAPGKKKIRARGTLRFGGRHPISLNRIDGIPGLLPP
jgi:hypothetical protein